MNPTEPTPTLIPVTEVAGSPPVDKEKLRNRLLQMIVQSEAQRRSTDAESVEAAAGEEEQLRRDLAEVTLRTSRRKRP